MNNLILKFSILLSVALSCSSKEEPVPEEEKSFMIKVYYVTLESNVKYHDTNSEAFIYYNFSTYDLIRSQYLYDGKLIKNDSIIILPDQQESADYMGIIHFNPIYTEKAMTVLIVSGFYKNRFATFYYQNYHQTIFGEATFNP